MKKKLTIVLMISLLLISALAMVFYAVSVQEWEAIENGFAGGNGTEDDPYIIKTPEQLEHFREHYLTIMNPVDGNFHIAYYKLGADLTFNDETFTFNPDTGLVEVTDGKNLAYFGTGIPGNDEGDNTVFDEVPSAKGVWYVSENSTEEGSYTGELNNFLPIGHDKRSFSGVFDGNGHTISGLFISSQSQEVGLFAEVYDGTLRNIKMTNSLIYSEGDGCTGAFGGYIRYMDYLSGNPIVIAQNNRVGGIAGASMYANYCSFEGVVSGNNNVGGVAGMFYRGTACRLHEGIVYGNENVGGVTGQINAFSFPDYQNGCLLSLSFSRGQIYGTNCVGGVFGSGSTANDYDKQTASVVNCYNRASVNGNIYVGGIAGKTNENVSIRTSYNAGKVNGKTAYCGGLVGKSQGTFSSCYHIKNYAAIGKTYQNTVGASEGTTAKDAGGCTTVQHSTNFIKTYVGFDFDDVWCDTDYTYPSLRCENAFAFPCGSGTAEDPYLVESAEQLALLVQSKFNYKDEYFLLTTDITLNDEIFTFNPDTGLVKVSDGTHTAYIGTGYPGDDSGSNTLFDKKASTLHKWYASETSDEKGSYKGALSVWLSDSIFYGNFDGGGHTITGLYSEYHGLFHHASSVQDVHIQDSLILGKHMDGWYMDTGSIATSIGYMKGCTSNAIVLSHGGLAGSCGVIEKSEFSGIVISNNNEYYEDSGGVGGIAGSGGTFLYCRNKGTVLGDENAGGIVGHHLGKIFSCINEGKVVATEHYAGGIVGSSEHSDIFTSYNMGKICSYRYAGGITGYCTTEQDSYGSTASRIQNCYYLSDSVFVKEELQNQGVGSRYDYKEQTTSTACPDTKGQCTMLSAAQMTQKESFAGFDFVNVYALPKGAPYPIFLHEVTEFETGQVLWDGSASKSYAGGNGTEKSPYLITTPEELKYFATRISVSETFQDDYYALGADIVFNDTSFAYWYKNAVSWEAVENFKGNFDGRGYSIRGLYIDENGAAGLFLNNSGTIQNLNVEDAYVNAHSHLGIIAVTNNGTIQNCHVDSRIETKYEAGGIACFNNGTIQNCSVGGYMSGFDTIGGIVNENNGTVQNCEMNAPMHVLTNAGGIVYTNNGTVQSCENNADIEAGERVGGIVKDNNGTVQSCQSNGKLYSEFQTAGIVYYTYSAGSVVGCQNYGDVTSVDAASGICTIYSGTTPLSDCQNSGTVTSRSYGGGIVSHLYTTVENCQNNGNVQGIYVTGGIVGELKNSALVQNCQNYASVVGTTHTTGGIAGRTHGSLSSVINCENQGTVNGKEKVGGIIGDAHAFASDKAPADIHSNRNYGTVSGEFEVGGIVGNNNRLLYNCYNSGQVTGLYDVGGIAGLSGYESSGFYLGSIRDCYNLGSINAQRAAGGIAGSSNGTVNTCYNIGNVLGNYFVGSIVGENIDKNPITDCYYLFGAATDGTVRQNAVGNAENGKATADSAENELCLTENQMKNPKNLMGFDFTQVWMYEEGQNNGLPVLRAFHTHVFDQKSTDEAYLKEAATCQTPAVYYVSCACGKHGEDTFVGGKNGAHTLSDLQSDATCHFKKCTLCEGIFEHEAHVYDDVCDNICNVCNHKSAEKHVYDYKANDDGHQITCIHCDHPKAAKMPHNYPDGKVTLAPTVDKEGEITFTCKECGHQAVDPISKLEPEPEPEPEPSVDDETEPESSENEKETEKEEVKNEQKNGDKNTTLYFLIGIGIGCIAVLICVLPFLLKKRKTE